MLPVTKTPAWLPCADTARLCLEADLRQDGTYGAEWLVVTNDRLLVVAKDGDAVRTLHDLPLAELKEPKALGFSGGGAFEVTRNDQRIEVIRYTSARMPRFSNAAGKIGKWLKGEEPHPEEEDDRTCPTCGLPREQGTKVCRYCAHKMKTLWRLFGYLGPHRRWATGLTVLAVLTAVLSAVPPLLMKPLMDDVLVAQTRVNQPLRVLGFLVLGLFGVHLTMSVAGVVRAWVAAWMGNRITHDIRCALYQHLQFLSLSFYDKRQTGSIISRVNQDCGQLQGFLVDTAQELITNGLMLAVISCVMFWYDWTLALCVVVPAPLVTIVWTKTRRRLWRFWHKQYWYWGIVNAVLNETLNGFRIVKAFSQEQREIKRFSGHSSALATISIVAERMWSTTMASMSILLVMGTLLVWYVGGRAVVSHGMSTGTLMVFIGYAGMFYGPIRYFSMLASQAVRALAVTERVFEVLDTEPEAREPEHPVQVGRFDGRIAFNEVTFGYQKHAPVLKHVSFEAQPGEMIGLVGHSGAGKSTCINLVCRFYDPDEGSITIDGVPLKQIPLATLRSQIGLVPQNTFLFGGTIADNIAYAKPGATREDVVRAAKIANAHDFIRRKSDGYETMLGENGKGLSAGECQRIAIARAVLLDPRILILDEATSQMDVETEKQIQEAVERLVAGRTTIAIAHRLSTLKHAHRLMVLKDGELIECGTHDELMAKENGEFARLVKTYQDISRVRAIER